MELDLIVLKPKTKYRSLEYYKLWSPKATNSKGNTDALDRIQAKINKLSDQVSVKTPTQGGSGIKCWTCGVDHVQAYCIKNRSGGAASWKCVPTGFVENITKVVGGVSWTYCGQCF